MINIGYACQIAGYRDFTIKTCRLNDANHERLVALTKENIGTLLRILQYNKKNKIRLFRISSDIVPFASHPEVEFDWRNEFSEPLQEIGQYVLHNRMRVSMHPGQYTVLNSPDEDVFLRALLDLEYHADFMDALGVPVSHKIVLHIGGMYGNKQEALKRFVQRARKLPEKILSRLILENDDKQFHIEDVLFACKSLGIPAVFDTLHHQCNPAKGNIPYFIEKSARTWKEADGTQKIHYSQQAEGTKAGVHSKNIDVQKWLADSKDFGGLDVMLEVKDKNVSAVKCNAISNGASRGELERYWGEYKYLLMRHSQRHYEEARKLFRQDVSAVDFFELMDEGLLVETTQKSFTNAVQHMWGYFKEKENAQPFLSLLERYSKGLRSENAVLSYLYRMAVKHKSDYLLHSYSFWLDG